MTKIDVKKIEELRGLLAKATPGPWSTHLVDDTTIISPDREVGTTCDSSQTERDDGYNIEYERMEADAAFIVAAVNALPALLDLAARALSERGEERGWIATTERLPEKPGKRSYEHVECLIFYKGEILIRPWNYKHLYWDNADGDDWFCAPTEPTHWQPLPAPPASTEKTNG